MLAVLACQIGSCGMQLLQIASMDEHIYAYGTDASQAVA